MRNKRKERERQWNGMLRPMKLEKDSGRGQNQTAREPEGDRGDNQN